MQAQLAGRARVIVRVGHVKLFVLVVAAGSLLFLLLNLLGGRAGHTLRVAVLGLSTGTFVVAFVYILNLYMLIFLTIFILA